jgi:hypothetical protein
MADVYGSNYQKEKSVDASGNPTDAGRQIAGIGEVASKLRHSFEKFAALADNDVMFCLAKIPPKAKILSIECKDKDGSGGAIDLTTSKLIGASGESAIEMGEAISEESDLKITLSTAPPAGGVTGGFVVIKFLLD